MDLRLTPDLIEIRERSRRFCDDWLIPFELETEEAGSLSMESYGRIRQAVLDANLNAMNMPVEWGGQGFSILQQVVALEQFGRVTNALWACVWRPALDVAAAARAVVALGDAMAAHPEIAELEINPLLVTPHGAVALDARIALNAFPPPPTE